MTDPYEWEKEGKGSAEKREKEKETHKDAAAEADKVGDPPDCHLTYRTPSSTVISGRRQRHEQGRGRECTIGH